MIQEKLNGAINGIHSINTLPKPFSRTVLIVGGIYVATYVIQYFMNAFAELIKAIKNFKVACQK